MSKPVRTTTTGSKAQPPPLPYRDEDGRVSGARRVLNYPAYDGLMQLGSDAFSAPLPPPQSERPRALRRLHWGWYVISAAAGFSAAAVLLAVVFKPSLSRQHAPIALASATAYSGQWTVIDGERRLPMREVLEPVEPLAPVAADAPVAAAPEPVAAAPEPVAAIAPPDVHEAAPSAPARDAPPPAAAASESVAPSQPEAHPPAVVPREATQSHAARAGAGSRHARDAAPVAQLSRAQVIAAMKQVEPEVAACFHGTRGTATANVTIIGRTGRVTTAQISGLSGAVGSCIARAVRHASFPSFKAESLTIRYPFAH